MGTTIRNERQILDLIRERTQRGLESLEEQDGERQRVRTPGGYEVAIGEKNRVDVYGPDGEKVASFDGSQVREGDGNGFFIGDDSTFILPDGTQIRLDLEPGQFGVGSKINAVDVVAGNDRLHVGADGPDGVTRDGRAFDRQTRDAARGPRAGVFALGSNGEFGVLDRDGSFYDVREKDLDGPQEWHDAIIFSDYQTRTPGVTSDQIGALDGVTARPEPVDRYQDGLNRLSELLDRLEEILSKAEGPSSQPTIDELLELLEELMAQRGSSGAPRPRDSGGAAPATPPWGDVGAPRERERPSGPREPGDAGRSERGRGTSQSGDLGSKIDALRAKGVDSEILVAIILAMLIEMLNEKLIDKAEELDEATQNNVEGGGGERDETEGVFGEGEKGNELLSRELQLIQENLSSVRLLANTILDNKNQVAQQLFA